ncbi:hypothetical protein GUITHDRAFT_140435 [Guillardia theta CCMP2712]|uniref:Uncharacterized protein n=1 Tax=Guillardia theta (strain CCMP2712) TaxID=905079 RepID=L1J5I1_GUITC|nr:hypothetical protein GUITHDRAFT_140435 [Guillardia theta CCMP2712]EKX43374.1 hypothetical protein GUITHDRAFT_140435 [Guillardia theta CCMP2712]|eukprot:XP_005830354.1 hypothetical protein GUITHDRAFT_140435 [Guillardia theta CCMP2712]
MVVEERRLLEESKRGNRPHISTPEALSMSGANSPVALPSSVAVMNTESNPNGVFVTPGKSGRRPDTDIRAHVIPISKMVRASDGSEIVKQGHKCVFCQGNSPGGERWASIFPASRWIEHFAKQCTEIPSEVKDSVIMKHPNVLLPKPAAKRCSSDMHPGSPKKGKGGRSSILDMKSHVVEISTKVQKPDGSFEVKAGHKCAFCEGNSEGGVRWAAVFPTTRWVEHFCRQCTQIPADIKEAIIQGFPRRTKGMPMDNLNDMSQEALDGNQNGSSKKPKKFLCSECANIRELTSRSFKKRSKTQKAGYHLLRMQVRETTGGKRRFYFDERKYS